MKKKMMALWLAAVMTFGIVGCGSTEAVEEAPKEAASEETVQEETAQEETDEAAESEEAAQPDGYPSKTISWIVPAPAGAGLDLPARALIDSLDLGGNVIVENIAGASNTIGTLEAASREADGYTILSVNSSGILTQPLLTDTGYTKDDFRPLAMQAPPTPYVVIVRPDSPVETPEDWLELLKSDAGFSYTVPNAGSAAHLGMITLLRNLGCEEKATFVPYTGTAEVTAAVLNGELDFGVVNVVDNVLPQEEAGTLRAIVVLNNEPAANAPQWPIISDYGVEGMDKYFGVQVIAVKKDTPEDIVAYLKQQINEALISEEYVNFLDNNNLGELRYYSEEEIQGIIDSAVEAYVPLLEELGMVQK